MNDSQTIKKKNINFFTSVTLPANNGDQRITSKAERRVKTQH